VIKSQKSGKYSGFSVLEALIAGVVLLIVLVGILQMYFITFYNAPKVENLVRANYILSKEAELIFAKSYTTLNSYVTSYYPKIVKDKNMVYTITCTVDDTLTWGKFIRLEASWNEGKETKKFRIEFFRAKL
jgi:Tfp pilus assembly protein PilV